MQTRTAHTPRRARLTAAGIALGVIAGGAIGAAPASAATADGGFTEEQLTADYPSNATTETGDADAPDPANWSIQMMDVFNTLRTDGDDAATGNTEVMAHNDAVTIEINTTSSMAQHERAIVDQYGDMALTMADGLGVNLGTIYAEAWEAGELPKTQALLTKSGGLIGWYASTNPPKNFFDFDRPYLQLNPLDENGDPVTTLEEGGQLRLIDKEDGDAWGSRSGAFPSGHTSQAYWQGTALATMLPELAPQILARTAEAGDNRIVMGAHYALDVISGRMMGQKIVQLRLADEEFAALVDEASAELHAVLEAGCGDALENCIAADTPYLSTDDALVFYEEKMSYGFPLTGQTGQAVTVPEGAESLLRSSHPDLTDEQRRQVFALTAIDSGHPLDEGEEESWQRLNLAAAMTADIVVNADGTVSLAADVPAPEAPVEEAPVEEAPEEPAADAEGTPLAPTGGDISAIVPLGAALLAAGVVVLAVRSRAEA